MEFCDEREFEQKLVLLLKRHSLKELRSWNYIPGGIHMNVCLENTQGSKYFLKIPRWQNLSHSEFEVYQFLSLNTKLPVAKPICYDNTLDIFLKPYFVVEYLEGKSCDFEYDISYQMGKFLRLLHDETEQVVDKWPCPSYENWREYLLLLAEKNLALCKPFIDVKNWTITKHIIESSAQLIPEFPKTVLLHRDFKSQNVLLSCNSDICAIVDFEWAHLGDSLFDLASTESYLSKAQYNVLSGYFSNKKFDFCEKLYCLYNLINLVHVMGRATYVLDSPFYFVMMKIPYLRKLLCRWSEIYDESNI
ncbi:aminoglycoside phosphotransferase family protein [Candidatus Uabimicrobium sp. HlEnr_7]|uniref:aminoglycoside phosphotransferase family protein n=1 Tax=Candidatus Uabimicrobium helgolandensis TaxID=3095367 RepID=UPI0035573273